MPCFKKIKTSVVVLSLMFVLSPAHSVSAGLLDAKALPLEMAQKAANSALKQCETDGYKVSVAVVDSGGNLKVVVKADGAGPHTTDSSIRKAYTANSLKRSTQELAEMIAKVPALHSLGKMNDNILMLGGGLPVIVEKHLVGGIGVGGAPGAHLDEACAKKGLESIGAE
ncbi:MAG: heme-binding protein [Candidatus Nitrohelix vancouverensis]|uniref:Heme-binding protein n=1 Tax=Candidatus Nitrohelix vancouverensis TaxID=2705534 RepID=A0A7T0C193_9BACT|nr:MAG: heme-binding protein [Candidatus Nitrohelix vancouverensis]